MKNKPILKFDSKNNFRIMHITDTHLNFKNIDDSVYLISLACEREKPDLAVLSGDIACNGEKKERDYCTDKLFNIFNEHKIPLAVCLGNHDTEGCGYSRNELLSEFNEYPYVIAYPECYSLPVYHHDKIHFNVWIFDTMDYEEDGTYASVSRNQINYYIQSSIKLEREAGRKIKSFAFQHIIVPEIYDALLETDKKQPFAYEGHYNKDKHYILNPSNTKSGVLLEGPCSSSINRGQFDAFCQRGDVLGVFSGHDHMSTFVVTHKNTDIGNSLSTRYNNDKFSTQYGYRIIDVNANNTDNYTTKSVHWFDMFTLADIKNLKNRGDKFGANLLTRIYVRGNNEKLTENTCYAVTKLLFGRKVKY